MAERLTSPENSQERNKELETVAVEKTKELEKSREKAAERAPEANTEKALENVERAIDQQKETAEKEQSSAKKEKEPRRYARTKKTLDKNFKTEMKDARQHMALPSRAFSAVIHNKVVEKTSEAVGATLARPNALLAGSFTALVLSGGVYIWARYYGYPLSGFETIGAFIIGWLLGIIFDFTRIMVTGKK